VGAEDVGAIVGAATEHQVDLVVVGPEAALVAGVVDALEAAGVPAFGPSAAAAELEGSKAFAKELMKEAGVPTASHVLLRTPAEAVDHLSCASYPAVLKADGLAAGKGVVIARDQHEADAALERLEGPLVVEEFLSGEEVSFIALCDGRDAIALAPSQDHKAAFDGDQGPNTGGMGAFCPAPIGTPELLAHAEQEVLVRTVHAMKRSRTPFRGLLYAGLMNTEQGLRVLEFNCRFGDPETQPLLMRLQTDLLDVLEAVVDDRLDEFAENGLAWDPRPAVCVVLASQGYPGAYAKGKSISGLAEAAKLPDVQVFHAGTKVAGNRIVTDGGRVLGVTAVGDTIATARTNAYSAIERISFPGMFFRKDIAAKPLKAEAATPIA
jgi:phosphoribosylamine--glycine ligase